MTTQVRRAIYISAAHKSSGKTLVSLGLCAALRQPNFSVQPFKKGPDYIDPIWLSQASGNPCYNLDFYTMSQREIVDLYQQQSAACDLSLIEGNKGLFDGLSITGGDANADLAKLLNVSVVLVLDASGITRGIAPLINGYQAFDSALNIAGVILNKVAGNRHQSKLVQAIEYYTDVRVLGAIRRSDGLKIDERHLGLKPANECVQSQLLIDTVAAQVSDQVDLSSIVSLSQHSAKNQPSVQTLNSAKNSNPNPNSGKNLASVQPQNPTLKHARAVIESAHITPKTLKVALIKDSAFGFYYPDDLAAFGALGVEIVTVDAFKDSALPAVDGLFIGGGFPEMHLAKLAANQTLLADIKTQIKSGLPTYAECGGLMYLTRKITRQHDSYPMAGVIEADTVLSKTPIGRGYVQLEPSENHPWNVATQCIYAHEFHYSTLENISPNTQYAYRVLRGTGVDGRHDGIIIDNLLASYTHLRHVAHNPWVSQFVHFMRKHTR